ncbi:4-hydroxythreonine-4-phosphate dehydrogenase PdxA [Pelagibius litoralis]|uniref:4-hydroxythreonine-4-phosphate dehydrogenase PdxA n=1 Tax=Pelagibius litoralis TaxID=374515 RepID=A0A967C4C6_9PROT|nr:4-hydroxythreonine-4-phosphate dehydrogenase PdxA [Pelagibius litoralis]NIA68500.1 4-hydroxythreonine-4-phosphate dehydrogenase PdxA [Pelagibius litoralis]
MKPKIALVQGDATGIGPELMAKLLARPEVREAADILVLSDVGVFAVGCAVAGEDIVFRRITATEEADWTEGEINLLDLPSEALQDVTPGAVSTIAGQAVLKGFGLALDLCKAGTADGLCFMPFNKEAMHLAGLGEEDETQWARTRIGHRGRVSEFNVIDGMWNARVTSHVPLNEVSGRLSEEEIVASVKLADQTLKAAGFARPKIAVAALNPHAGDGGKIGREEIEIIAPAVERARALQISCDGPFPSDTLYIKVRDGDYDCAVSMYHDQGQIAIKLLGFHMGVSVLSGLPFPMTTPAHGTAFDIVGQNKANVEPARRAFMMCAEMAANRREDAA